MLTNMEGGNKEKAILDAAEQVFLDKGYAASRTTEIAKMAGVTHAMLHYYYRTKENLFNKVFDEKIQLLNNSFSLVFGKDLPFLEKVKLAVETHFDFLAENPKLPSFLLREVITNQERKEVFKGMLFPKLVKVFISLEKEIKAEIEKGTIVDISPANLLLNIGSLNAASIVAVLVLFEDEDEQVNKAKEEFLRQRKASNVDFILRSLRP